MDKRQYKQMLKNAVQTDGLQWCLDALQEEASELIQAISHLRRGRKTKEEVIKEMADVTIMLEMCRIGFDGEIGFKDRIKAKSMQIGEAVKFKMENNHGKVITDKSIEA